MSIAMSRSVQKNKGILIIANTKPQQYYNCVILLQFIENVVGVFFLLLLFLFFNINHNYRFYSVLQIQCKVCLWMNLPSFHCKSICPQSRGRQPSPARPASGKAFSSHPKTPRIPGDSSFRPAGPTASQDWADDP